MVGIERLGHWVTLAALCGASIGCASSGGISGSSGGGVVAVFPSKDRLAEIEAEPLPDAARGEQGVVSVPHWTVESGTQRGSLVNERISAKAKRKTLRATAELTCAAGEMARFMALHSGMPDQQLRSHLLGQCGAAVPEHNVQFWTFELRGANPSDETLLAELDAELGKYAASLPRHALDVGAALVRGNGRAVLGTVHARRYAELEALPPLGEDGALTISGQMLAQPAALIASITRGEHGVGRCTFDPKLRLPRFRATCRMDPDDSAAWVDIQLLEPGRVLARGAVRLLVRRSEEPEPFVAAEAEDEQAAPDVAGYRRKLLAALNGLRKNAGLKPLDYAERQSARHEALAPHFFAHAQEDSSYVDDIAMGLMAGWEVPGTIRDGSFYGVALSGTLSPERWLSHLLEYPSARAILFDPQARTLALGPMIDTRTSTLGALISTYSFYEDANHDADRKRVIELVDRGRQSFGSPRARIHRDPELEGAVLAIKQGMSPEGALNDALANIARRDGRNVQGMVLETLLLDGLELPEELTRRPHLDYAVEVTHVRHPDAAWGTLVILFVIVQPKTQTATLPSTPHG